jgi:hypothetical protein
MASISSPYGFEPINDQTGIDRTLRIPNGIQSGLASNIFKYQPVTLNPVTGTIIPITNPGGVPQQVFGIFMGCEFSPIGGRPEEYTLWPSGSTPDPVFNFFVYVWPAYMPGTRFRVQADGSVPQALLGSQFNITNAGNGNTTTGLSACTVGAAGVAAGSQGQFALVEFFDTTGIYGTIGDAYTDLIVTSTYPQVGFGSQKSIG